MMSPFYLLDYNSKIDFSPSEEARGVDVHPHKGFETVTIAYHGKIAHEDSAGNRGVIEEGGVQWMTAGSGLLHKEFHEEGFQKNGGAFQMIQLWVNLPAKFKQTPPKYQDIKHSDKGIYELSNGQGKVFVIAGEFKGVKGPANTFTPINLWDIRLQKGAELEFSLDSTSNTGVLAVSGSVKLNEDKEVPQDHFALLNSSSQGGNVKMVALSDEVKVLLMDGQPINEPIAQYGPFLMNTMEEVQEAIREFQTGKYGKLK